MLANFSLYLHIPFCIHRCSYCDFNTYAGQDHLRQSYVDALCREAEIIARSAPERLPVHTIFFGGGTPSMLSAGQMRQIFTALFEHYDVQPAAEISLEANPGTLSPEYLTALHELAFNRISLGMQSAHPDDLRLLERQHSVLDVIHSVKWARQAGFDNLNLDLMFGLPYQSLERWKGSLERALDLRPDHLSLYALTLEHGTPFQHWTNRGLIPEADSDLAADMYEWAMDRLEQAGFVHYEISNWAYRPAGQEPRTCLHNLQYWRNQPYIGLGAGAHGYAGGSRTANVLGIAAYIQRMQSAAPLEFTISPASVTVNPIDQRTEMQETMMVGLRLVQEGVSAASFERRFARSLEDVFGAEIHKLLEWGLLEWAGQDGDCLRLTRRGRLLGNQVFMQFVGD